MTITLAQLAPSRKNLHSGPVPAYSLKFLSDSLQCPLRRKRWGCGERALAEGGLTAGPPFRLSAVTVGVRLAIGDQPGTIPNNGSCGAVFGGVS